MAEHDMSLSQTTFERRLMPQWQHSAGTQGSFGPLRRQLWPAVLSIALVAFTTAGLIGLSYIADLPHVSVVYLMPVLISATLWGVVPAVVAALMSMAGAAFFFYPPIYSLQVHDPLHLLDLLLFVMVAVVTGRLASNLRGQMAIVHQRESEMRALYAFSKRLAATPSVPEIYAAIEDHLARVLGRRVLLDAVPGEGSIPARRDGGDIPEAVRAALRETIAFEASNEAVIVDPFTGANWLLRPISQKTLSLGMVAVDIGRASDQALSAIRQHVDSILADASATLERLDVDRALGEAKMRMEVETFRNALIESVSHELRTPLASILSSTYILADAPGVKQDSRLAALAEDLRHEAQRLDDDIQNLLDASRITSAGVQPHLQWAEAADIVNAALNRQHSRLRSHSIEVRLPDELPLVHVDPALMEQAIGQILHNAAKYSPPGSTILIGGATHGPEVSIEITDRGDGLTGEERIRIWERFYRSPRHHASSTGSGLGLWIARAFVQAIAGRIEVASPGAGRGTSITVYLPAPRPTSTDEIAASDE
jgi:two-component system sensor histidine kinase KdpD